MVFSSLLFIFKFMPIFFLIYYLSPKAYRNVVLLIGSIIFYAWGEPRFLILIIVSILVNYIIGRAMDNDCNSIKRRKLWLIVSLVFNIGMLVIFKYLGFIVENLKYFFHLEIPAVKIELPLGISFYTFQIMSYVIDLYNHKIKVEKSLINLGTYICMFPQLIAGPIVQYVQVAEELNTRKYDLAAIDNGMKTFILGVGSKVLIANNIGALWKDMGQIGYANLSMPLAWMGILAYSLQMYFDFNGYSLMAIGLGEMLGFHFPQNFNYPYISRSITEFWRRWHITLSSWFKEYIYIPLGGNRKGKGRMYFNMFVVWSVTGLWHGASWNFVIWGLYFFVLLSIEKLFLKKWLDSHEIISRIYSIVAIMISWMIFAITDFAQIGIYVKKLVGFTYSLDWVYYLRNYGAVLIIGIILSTPCLEKWYAKYKNRWLGAIVLLGIFVLSVAYLADAAYNPFLYFRF